MSGRRQRLEGSARELGAMLLKMMDDTSERVASLKLFGVDRDGGEHAIVVGVATRSAADR